MDTLVLVPDKGLVVLVSLSSVEHGSSGHFTLGTIFVAKLTKSNHTLF